MRNIVFIILMMLLATAGANAQEKKPRIVGQKDLSTQQGEPITVQLTDLYVEETNDDDNNGNGNNNGGDDGDDDEDNGDDDGDDDEDKDNGDDDDDRDEDDEDDRDEDSDNDEDGGDNKGKDDNKGKGKKGDKDNKGKKDDENEKKGKDNKDKGKGKGNGNRRQSYPEGYVLEIFNGSSYTVTGNTVTPDASFSGVLTVLLRVKNSKHASPKYSLKITVTAKPVQNNPPAITGQISLSTPMGTSLEIKLSHLKVSDIDNQFPEGFSLMLQPGENYTISNKTTVNPSPGFLGNIFVPVVVNDGKDNSEPFSLKITVTGSATVTNTPPKITGQLPLNISVNQSVEIVLTHLLVSDPDNDFPGDFTLKVFPGEGYTLSNSTVTPPLSFSGDLAVKVSVTDGKAESAVYSLKVTVDPDANKKPAITGQTGIKIPQGQSLKISLTHLVVEDADNKFPDDFTLRVMEGANYTVANQTITHALDFLGTLTVGVTVHDGVASSDPFYLKAEVVANDRMEIVGQRSLEIAEDSSLLIQWEDLVVNDPSDSYPAGYSLKIHNGENYNVRDGRIEPHREFYGNLTVPVSLSKGSLNTDPFSLLVVVDPVNDAPELLNVPGDPVAVTNRGPWALFETAEVHDVDDDHLVYAEIAFDQEGYHSGIDRLEYDASDSIHAVFDSGTGVLFMVGRASLNEYQSMIRSVKYTYDNQSDSLFMTDSKTIRVELNDGKITSKKYERLIAFEVDVPLEIPTAFTPNNDNANDTWKITSVRSVGPPDAFIRVYDKKGIMVFESRGLEQEWDGHFRGDPLPPDVYFYTIEMDLANRKVNFKGIVSILR